ncbi:MAG: HPr family phosphocarrier protein [Deltaproteobacteria bacterium]|jgi:phosphocarrier protein HPr|nr:HPr family phosphocarrier protein [Deltaproteobacteria bacterium]MBN2845225.1 HPr family phosphocarrier protein [Deltaproteobacteria bacterium]
MREIRTFILKNELGLHARAAAMMVTVASKYKADIILERDGREVEGKSILGILTLACPKGSSIIVKAEGEDALDAVNELEELVEKKFGEE